jgi:hypothetical protein
VPAKSEKDLHHNQVTQVFYLNNWDYNDALSDTIKFLPGAAIPEEY